MVVLDAIHWIQAHGRRSRGRWNCKAAKWVVQTPRWNGKPALM